MGITDEIGKNEIIKSTKDSIYSKITSPLWGTFILSWLIWNWKILYTTIFVDGDKIFEKYELLKIEYILNNLYNGAFFYFQLPIFVDYIIFWFIGPILSTIIILGFIPYISNYVYIRDVGTFKKSRIQAKKKMERDIEKQFLVETKKDNSLLEEVEAELEKKNKLLKDIEDSKKQINKNKSQEDKWNEEYERVDLNLLETLKNIHYQDGGVFRENYGAETWRYPMSKIVTLELNGLFKKNSKIDGKITEKGMFFLKKLSEENDFS